MVRGEAGVHHVVDTGHGVVFGGTGLPSWLSRFITPSRRWMMKVAAYYASLNDAQFARTAAS
jgi:hypothetical protein